MHGEPVAPPSNGATPVAELCALVKTYLKPDGSVLVQALDGIDLRVERGEFVAIMGASGSGKSTLMNILGCLDRATTGSYCLDGRDVSQMSDDELSRVRREKIGFVFQAFNLIPVLTAFENVELPLLLTNLTRAERREHALTALALVGLSDRAEHSPRQLSGGQEQRVGIARAVVTDPTLLLCDEPTGDLDRKAGDEVLELLQTLNREHGKTIVMVTHDPHAAERARQTLHLEKGTLMEAVS